MERTILEAANAFFNMTADSVIQNEQQPPATVKDDNHYTFYIVYPDRVLNVLRAEYGKPFINHIVRSSPVHISVHKWFLPELLFMLEGIIKPGINYFTVSSLISEIKKSTWVKDTLGDKKPIIDLKEIERVLKWKPLDHQLDYLKFYDDSTNRYNINGSLFASAPGSGKTATGLFISEGYRFERIIIVCPKPVVYDPWVKTIKDVYKKPQRQWCVNDKHSLSQNDRFIIINYEYIDKLNLILSRFKRKRTLIILDESHNLNNIKAKRTLEFKELCDSYAANTLFLSGTPVKASSTEIIPLLKVIDPLFDSDAEDTFRKLFRSKRDNVYKVLHRRLGFVSKVVEKKGVMSSKPEVETQVVKFKGSEKYTLTAISKDMTRYINAKRPIYEKLRPEALDTFYALVKSVPVTKGYDDYRTALNTIVKSDSYFHLQDEMRITNSYEKEHIYPKLTAENKRKWKEVKALAKYPNLKIVGECLGRVLGRARIDCNVDIAKHIDYKNIIESSYSKTLMFSNSVEVVQQIGKSCKPYKAVQVYGKNTKSIKDTLEMFRDTSTANPLATTYASLSTGVPLIMCSTVVIVDSPFRDYILNQAIARIDRLGQPHPVKVVYIELDTGGSDNINSRSLDLAKWSADEVSKIMNIDMSTPYDDTLDDGFGIGGRYGDDGPTQNDRQLPNYNPSIGSMILDLIGITGPDGIFMKDSKIDMYKGSWTDYGGRHKDAGQSGKMSTGFESTSIGKEVNEMLHDRTPVYLDW